MNHAASCTVLLSILLSLAVAAPWRKAAAGKNEVTQTEVPCSPKRKAVAKRTVETQTEAPHMYVRKAVAKKNEDTQTEIPKQDAGVQFSGCRERQSLALPAFSALGEGGSNCVRCDQVNYLLSLMVDLKDEVERLRSVKECERETDCWYQTLSAPRSRQPGVALHGVSHLLPPCNQVTEGNQHADSVPAAVNPLSSPPPRINNEESGDVGQWHKAPAHRCRRALPVSPQPPQLPLQNRYSALQGQLDNGGDDGSPQLVALPKSDQSSPSIKTSSIRKKQRVIVVGDSLLKGAEGPICRPDPLHREVCCLPGVRVKDVRKKLPSLVRPTDYYPLLLFQAGSDDFGSTSLRTLKKDFRALGRQVKGSGAHTVLSSIPPAVGNNERLDIVGQWINTWLRAWCARQGFGFFDLGSICKSLRRLAADRSGFSHRLRGVLRQELGRLFTEL